MPLAHVSAPTDAFHHLRIGRWIAQGHDRSVPTRIQRHVVVCGPADGCWSVVFDPFEGVVDDAVSAILAGPFLTERRLPAIRGVLPEGWTAAPFALVETGGTVTTVRGVAPGPAGVGLGNRAGIAVCAGCARPGWASPPIPDGAGPRMHGIAGEGRGDPVASGTVRHLPGGLVGDLALARQRGLWAPLLPARTSRGR